MTLIGNTLNVDVRIGNYPYAAWYTQESYEKGEWEGYWFANPSEKPITIYISDAELYDEKTYGFFHELGHVTDYVSGKKFKTTWEDEVSAWRNALELMVNKFNLSVDLERFSLIATECLATYRESENKTFDDTKYEISTIVNNFKQINKYKEVSLEY